LNVVCQFSFKTQNSTFKIELIMDKSNYYNRNA